jgi:hypothetical protein
MTEFEQKLRKTIETELDSVDFETVSNYGRNLSEEFLHDFKDKLNWFRICQYTSMSEQFIMEHINYIHIAPLLFYNQSSLSDEFKSQLRSLINIKKL